MINQRGNTASLDTASIYTESNLARRTLVQRPNPFDRTMGRFISLMATHYTGQDGWITNRQLHYKHNDNRMFSLIEKVARRSIQSKHYMK